MPLEEADTDLDNRLREDSPSIPLITNRRNHNDNVHQYIQFGMGNIEGWGVDPFLAQLFLNIDHDQKSNGISGNLFEIGVHHGRSAILLALMAAAHETAVFIDLFERQNENIDFSGHGNRDIFEENLRAWAPEQPVDIVQANSIDLEFSSIQTLESGVRFAHIDGAHYRAAVINDLIKTEAITRDGGIVIVDDFVHTGFPGVNEACNHYLELDRTTGLAPIALGHNKLILTTKSHHDFWIERLSASTLHPIGTKVTFHEQTAICLDAH